MRVQCLDEREYSGGSNSNLTIGSLYDHCIHSNTIRSLIMDIFFMME